MNSGRLTLDNMTQIGWGREGVTKPFKELDVVSVVVASLKGSQDVKLLSWLLACTEAMCSVSV